MVAKGVDVLGELRHQRLPTLTILPEPAIQTRVQACPRRTRREMILTLDGTAGASPAPPAAEPKRA